MIKKNSTIAICSLILILHLASCTNQTEQKVEAHQNTDDELTEKKIQNPKIPSQELAHYGNSLLNQKGFNFHMDLADLVEKKNKTKETKTISNENNFLFKRQVLYRRISVS